MIADKKNTSTPTGSHEIITADMYESGLKITIIGMVINALLIILKLIGGIIGNSAAMIADAFHSVSDSITDVGVIVGLKFLSRPADSDHAYGHGRVETAISFLIALVIIITGIGIFKSGAGKILQAFDGVFPHKPGIIALGAGIISLFCKEGLFHYTRAVAKKSGSRTLEANAWHHRSDAFSSVGTVIGISGAIILGSRWTILDPIAAVFVSILITKVGVGIGWDAFKELSDESLSRQLQLDVEVAIKHVKGVQDCHNIRTRSLSRYATVDAHVIVDPKISVAEGHVIATDVENTIRKTLQNAAFVTIHIEPYEVN